MVYRIAGVYRRRIDEIRPHFPDAQIVEDADETVLRITPRNPGDVGIDARATPAGFYIHWWSTRPGFAAGVQAPNLDAATKSHALFAKLGTWTAELNDAQMYANYDRKSDELVVGRYRLFPFAADPDLSARVIREGMDEASRLRRRVEEHVTSRLVAAAATEQQKPKAE